MTSVEGIASHVSQLKMNASNGSPVSCCARYFHSCIRPGCFVDAKRAFRSDPAGRRGLPFENPLEGHSDQGAHNGPDDVDPSRVEVATHKIWRKRTHRAHRGAGNRRRAKSCRAIYPPTAVAPFVPMFRRRMPYLRLYSPCRPSAPLPLPALPRWSHHYLAGSRRARQPSRTSSEGKQPHRVHGFL